MCTCFSHSLLYQMSEWVKWVFVCLEVCNIGKCYRASCLKIELRTLSLYRLGVFIIIIRLLLNATNLTIRAETLFQYLITMGVLFFFQRTAHWHHKSGFNSFYSRLTWHVCKNVTHQVLWCKPLSSRALPPPCAFQRGKNILQ